VSDFKREIQISISCLCHPHVISAHSACFGPKPRLCLEFTPLGSLDSLRKEMTDPFSRDHIFTMLMDVAVGMNFLHIMGLIHQDMNLGNLLVFPPFSIKISDFGSSRMVYSLKSKTPDRGAEKFRAPEAHGQSYNQQCDIWSLGMLVGISFALQRLNWWMN